MRVREKSGVTELTNAWCSRQYAQVAAMNVVQAASPRRKQGSNSSGKTRERTRAEVMAPDSTAPLRGSASPVLDSTSQRPLGVAMFRSVAVLLLAFTVPAWSQADPPEPDDVASRFAEAWNAHDAAAFGRLLVADADWVTASGLRLHGRAKIQEYLAKEHSTWAGATTMRVVSIHVRALSPGAASVFFEWEIVASSDANPAAGARRGNNLFVVSQTSGEWQIVAGQVARAPEKR
jgi:uncharacterized protein (TIGR02246 family)